ncbi:MAG TPA: cyclic nucleotide-binding domain-containing protein [Sedimenticola sp.]|nr:cyclic nucleotide-binding domain-containing protein [Sedimenticola sp.]
MTAKKSTLVDCNNCEFSCIRDLLTNDDRLGLFERLLKRQQQVLKGETVFRHGQPFHAGYAVTSGTFMSYRLLEGGEEQVLGFHLPGEPFGLDGVRNSKYEYTTKALEEGFVCELGFHDLGLLGDSYQEFQEQLILVMSGQLIQAQRQSLLAARPSAEERLAAFLLNLSQRLSARGFNATDFRLSMSRKAIACYLGLAEGTVSRVFKRFEAQKLLAISAKKVHLLDADGLDAYARILHSG